MKQLRLKTISLTIVFCFAVVITRLFYWQIIKYSDYSQKISNQNYKPSLVPAQRGKIFDVQNNPLALNQTYYYLSIYKPDLKIKPDNILDTIKKIRPNLNLEDESQIIKFANNSNHKWLTLKDYYDNSQKLQLTDPGFSFSPINLRFYPEDQLAKLILGTTTIDQAGNLNAFGGLESYYHKQLKGKSGFIWEAKDATGQTLLSKPGWYIEAVDGRNLHTSINRQVQSIVEQSLQDGIDKFAADSGSITIMSPQSGAIIAMSSFTATSSATPSATHNAVITDLFEPGSIFKPLVVSMALDTNSINLNFICTQCNRPHQIGQYAISNWDNALHPDSSLQDIIKNSDNIGMSYIIANLGLKNFLNYFPRLGLTQKTGIDLQGEVRPLSKSSWPEIDLATASFGQGFAITQIQMLTAFNTIANDGLLTKPHLVDYFQDNEVIIPNSLAKSIPIFQPSTMVEMKRILKYAVENGVVAKFKPENIEVCAKSGTSQIAIKGGYSDSSTIASYIGFSPCNNPKFTMIVTINNPKSSPWGSSTAAPIWYEIAQKLQPLL